MKMQILIIGLIAALFNFMGLAQAETEKNPFYNEQKSNVVVVQDEPEFTIKLKSNPSTGFSWFLREYNTDLILPLKHRLIKSDSKLAGADGIEEWTFRMKHLGFSVPQQTVLRFVYSRPWQGAEGATSLVFRVSTIEK